MKSLPLFFVRSLRAWLRVLVFVLAATPAVAQSGANVLVVANANSPDSLQVAQAYARARSVPADQVLQVQVSASAEEVERAVFDLEIQAPIAEWLARNAAQDRILYIVLTKGVPLRIKGTTGRNGTMASVDSELALLYQRLAGRAAPVPASLPNPYYLADKGIDQAERFTHARHEIYLVTRLDGFTLADTLALIDRSLKATRNGRFVLDEKAGLSDEGGDAWLQKTADWLRAKGLGDRVFLDQTTYVVKDQKEILGYYSWGSNDPANRSRHLGLGFVPGALAGMFVSTDARSFREPPAAWALGRWNDRSSFFAGSPQSLAGDLIRDGVTGISGHVAEPYLDATVRPNILFPAYVSGFNLAESFYLATPFLSWQTVIVGDPLCAPFARTPAQAADIDGGLDPTTELPRHFSERRLATLTAGGTRTLLPLDFGSGPAATPTPSEKKKARPQYSSARLLRVASTKVLSDAAARAVMRAEARSARGDSAGMEKALEEATTLDPTLNVAHLLLAAAYEQRGLYDQAIERYRRMIENLPQEAIALNNLAYSLAVRKNQPAEALGYAERAYQLAPTGTVADTLAWVQHLLGRDEEAVRLLSKAVTQVPGNAEVRLHAAVVYAARGMLTEAQTEFAEAVRLDPAMATREEAKALRMKQ